MKRLGYFILVMFMILAGSQMVNAQSIDKIEITLSNDSLTGLQRKAIVSEFYIGWGLNQSGTLDTTAQFIYIYCNVVTLDVNGNVLPNLSERKTIRIVQGTDEFNSWFNMFDANFKSAVSNEMTLHQGYLETKENTTY